ncbi:MarR family transcriptional regulator [Pseudoalteromonas fenneropenaei]|uniref:MarR family transcriptional regulator n=1 Tax=Pseudoalteromonas fenneropenaei TaxID=1737459 RepID=A0ABV7CJ86_9GAMM
MTQELCTFKQLSLAEQLGRVSRLWKMVADKELAPLGLTHPRWTALLKLQRLGDHIGTKQLAEALEIELPSLMRTLSQLEEQGLVTRHCCPNDKRTRIIHLTDSGKALLTEMESHILSVRRTLLASLNDEQQAALSQTLAQIAENALVQLALPSISTGEKDDA